MLGARGSAASLEAAASLPLGPQGCGGDARPAASRPLTRPSFPPAGNTVAKIVSPIVSVVVVTLVGAAVSYFQRNRRRGCFRTHGK